MAVRPPLIELWTPALAAFAALCSRPVFAHLRLSSLFLSHTWSSGQDQVAVIRRRLCSELLPGSRIFLDVEVHQLISILGTRPILAALCLDPCLACSPRGDGESEPRAPQDLDDTAHLEEHVEASTVVLVFLSRGYFLSANCLREVRHALAVDKPIVLIHEVDRNKGGATLQELKDECPEDLRAAVFEGRSPIPWLRLGPLQRETLVRIAEIVVIHSPAFNASSPGSMFNLQMHNVGNAFGGAIGHATKAADRISFGVAGAAGLAPPAQRQGSLAPSAAYAPPPAEETDEATRAATRIQALHRGRRTRQHIRAQGLMPASPGKFVRAGTGKLIPRVKMRSDQHCDVLYVPRAVTELHWQFKHGRVGLYVSRSNPGADAVARQYLACIRPKLLDDGLWISPTMPEGMVAPLERMLRSGETFDTPAKKAAASKQTRSPKKKTRSKSMISRSMPHRPKLPSSASVKGHLKEGAHAVSEGAHAVSSRMATRLRTRGTRAQPVGAASAASAKPTSGAPKCPDGATHFLLLLSAKTFVGADGEQLAMEVRAAREAGVPLLMIHQNDAECDGCEFSHFFDVTPKDLILAGLYRPLAVPWYPEPHLKVCCAIATRTLGGVPAEKRSGLARILGLSLTAEQMQKLHEQLQGQIHEITGTLQHATDELGKNLTRAVSSCDVDAPAPAPTVTDAEAPPATRADAPPTAPTAAPPTAPTAAPPTAPTAAQSAEPPRSSVDLEEGRAESPRPCDDVEESYADFEEGRAETPRPDATALPLHQLEACEAVRRREVFRL